MRIYHLKTCDTCRNAIKALSSRAPALHEIRADGLERNAVETWIATVGEAALINTRSRTWRELPEDERKLDAVDLILAHPTVMKRPVIICDGQVLIGWNDATREALGAG